MTDRTCPVCGEPYDTRLVETKSNPIVERDDAEACRKSDPENASATHTVYLHVE